jgi:CRP/FNR family cyclic AMP-dependent transcriptional regulator
MIRHARIEKRLGEVPLFEGLSKKQLGHAASLTSRVDAPAGVDLVREGKRGREFIIVLEGETEVRQGGRLVATRGPGDYVGEMALVDNRPRSATVHTTTPVLVDVMSRSEFLTMLADFPHIADRIHATIAERRSQLAENILN